MKINYTVYGILIVKDNLEKKTYEFATQHGRDEFLMLTKAENDYNAYYYYEKQEEVEV